MPVTFHHHQQPVTFYHNAISLDQLNGAGLTETYDAINMQHAGMTFRNWCFDGYRLAYSVLQQEQETIYNIKNDLDAVKIYFNKKGRTHINYHQLDKECMVRSGQFNMLYAAELDSCMWHDDAASEMFSLQVTTSCFLELVQEGNIAFGSFAEKVVSKQPALLSGNWLPMNPAMERCIYDIINCTFAGDLKKMYLRAKAVELFILFANASGEELSAKNVFVKNSSDRDKLYFIKEYLTENYASPASLEQLSKLSGLNEFKLKNGFRELFNTSVIDFLIQQRLEQAQYLLQHTDKNISEVAYETGYTSPAYFSKAFKKKYGVSPKGK